MQRTWYRRLQSCCYCYILYEFKWALLSCFRGALFSWCPTFPPSLLLLPSLSWVPWALRGEIWWRHLLLSSVSRGLSFCTVSNCISLFVFICCYRKPLWWWLKKVLPINTGNCFLVTFLLYTSIINFSSRSRGYLDSGFCHPSSITYDKMWLQPCQIGGFLS